MIADLVFAVALFSAQSSSVNVSRELDTLLWITGDTNITSLAYGSMLQIHPVIQNCYGKADVEVIESRIKENLSPLVFQSALNKTYKINRDPKKFAAARKTFSTPVREKLKRLEGRWNSQEGRKAYQEFLKDGISKVPNSRKMFLRAKVDNSESHIMVAKLFSMAVNAQFEAALALKGKPSNCSELQLREQISAFGEGMKRNIKEEIFSDLLFLYVNFSDDELEQLFESEKDQGFIWYDKFRWEALATGYKDAVSSIQFKK